jgi:nicotinamidase-related amidase
MKGRDQSGITSDQSEVALLLVDAINDFDFPAAQKLLRFALPAARRIAALKQRLAKQGIPIIYVNDNFGRWRSDFKSQIERCTADTSRGAEIAKLLLPNPEDYFVLKPRHSGFFASSLEILLSSLGVKKLIITGFAADICVLFTANDAFMRGYDLVVPADCVASETVPARKSASGQMKRFLHADIRPSSQIRIVAPGGKRSDPRPPS